MDGPSPVSARNTDSLQAEADVFCVTEHQWKLIYSLLQGYVEDNGDTLVSKKHTTPEGHKLGSWVGNQHNTKESLTHARIKHLDDPGFI